MYDDFQEVGATYSRRAAADEQIENEALRRHHAKRSIGGVGAFLLTRARPVGSAGVVTASSVGICASCLFKTRVHDYRLPRLAEPSFPICRCRSRFRVDFAARRPSRSLGLRGPLRSVWL
jgi:hypothetical protein